MYGNQIRTISNTNELLGNYEGVYGVKTGFTFNAGRCLVTACKKNNLDIIAVVLGADSKKDRTIDSVKVLNYIFKNYTRIDISNIIYEEFDKFEKYFSKNVKIKKSTDKALLELCDLNNTTFPLQKNEINNITFEIFSLSNLSSPIDKDTKIGEINTKVNDEILVSSNILIKNKIERKNWKMYYKEILQNYFKF